jgi:[ribosomal protein S18]-alanine N-acetyltransferase
MPVTKDPYPPIEDRYVSLLWAEVEMAEDIATMHAQLFDPAWDANALRDLLAEPGASALVAKVRLRELGPPVPVGFAIGRIAADEAEVLTIGVTEPFQRRGIGAKLANGMLRAVTSAGAKRLFLEVAADNAAASGLYHSLGFVEAGRRKGYYNRRDGMAADALILELDLARKP